MAILDHFRPNPTHLWIHYKSNYFGALTDRIPATGVRLHDLTTKKWLFWSLCIHYRNGKDGCAFVSLEMGVRLYDFLVENGHILDHFRPNPMRLYENSTKTAILVSFQGEFPRRASVYLGLWGIASLARKMPVQTMKWEHQKCCQIDPFLPIQVHQKVL